MRRRRDRTERGIIGKSEDEGRNGETGKLRVESGKLKVKY
jgi:hypothetical protein